MALRKERQQLRTASHRVVQAAERVLAMHHATLPAVPVAGVPETPRLRAERVAPAVMELLLAASQLKQLCDSLNRTPRAAGQ